MVTPLEDLDPMTRSYALVGRFLQHWALMEMHLHDAIGKALGLDRDQQAIVCANIQLRDKLSILKTATDLAPIFPDEIKQGFIATLTDIGNYSHIRNMMAHDLFGPNEDRSAVLFLLTKAKGKLKFPDMEWTVTEFEAAYDKVDGFADKIKALITKLKFADLIKALIKENYAPKSYSAELGLLNLPVPPPPVDQPSGMSPASPETDGGTPPSPDD